MAMSSQRGFGLGSEGSPPSRGPAHYVARTRKWALIAVVLISFFGAAAIAEPLWIPLVFGGVMAISAHRPYALIAGKLGVRRSSWAAGLVTLGSGLLLAIVGTFVLVALTNELMKLVTHLNEHSNGSLDELIGSRPAHAIQQLGFDTAKLYAWIQRQAEVAAAIAAKGVAVVFRTTSQAVLGLVIALFTMYYVLREGEGIALRIERVSPLDPRHTRALIAEAREVGRTAFIGTIATALIQGALAGIGYAVLGVPQPVTWAIVTALASFLPVIGTLVVWVPLSGYLVLDGHPVRGLVLALWGIFIVTSLADYVIRPRIVGGRGHRHPLLTLIALLGGIEVFGLAGLIIAPIIMSVFVAALRIYEREAKVGGVSGTTTEGSLESSTGPSSVVPSARSGCDDMAPLTQDVPNNGHHA
jgi:predicted PurR-regulated permease PerM